MTLRCIATARATHLLALSVAVLLASASSQAAGESCGWRVTSSREALRFLSRPLDPAPQRESLSLEFSRLDSTESQAIDSASAALRVSIVDEDGAALPVDIGDARRPARLSVTAADRWRSVGASTFETGIAAGVAPPLDIDLVLNEAGLMSAGEFERRLRVDLVDLLSGERCEEIMAIPVQIAVERLVQVNIAGVQARFDRSLSIATIDLGELSDGAQRRVFVQVRTNTTATLSVRSENRGNLRAVDGSAAIPYRAALDGRWLDLADPAVVPIPIDPVSDAGGVSLALDISVSAGAAKPAGRYDDLLIVELSGL